MTRKLVDAAIDMSNGDILYRDFIIITAEGLGGDVFFEWIHEDDEWRVAAPYRRGECQTPLLAIQAIDRWYEQQVAA